jgi:hypothetical protein
MGWQRCQRSSEFFGHGVDRLQAVDDVEQAPRPVVFGDRRGLRAIDLQPGLEDLGVVVPAHRLASVGRFLGAAPDAVEQRIFVDLELKDRVKLDTPGG